MPMTLWDSIMRILSCVAILSIAFVPALRHATSQTASGTSAPPALSQNIGKAACNATNGTYRGRIVDVTQFGSAWVYVVEREGRRMNAPPDNTKVADQCSDGEPRTSPSATPTATQAAKPDVSPTLMGTASEFSRRLVSFQGQLVRLGTDPKAIRAEWTSKKCDMFEGEIIDLLLSLNRGHAGPVTLAIMARRSCGGVTRTFQASAADFELYRRGKINDLAILKGIK